MCKETDEEGKRKKKGKKNHIPPPIQDELPAAGMEGQEVKPPEPAAQSEIEETPMQPMEKLPPEPVIVEQEPVREAVPVRRPVQKAAPPPVYEEPRPQVQRNAKEVILEKIQKPESYYSYESTLTPYSSAYYTDEI